MILVRQIDGAWQRWSGAGPVTQYVTTASLHYADGRVAEIQTDPYPVEIMLDAGKVAQLVADGTWDEAKIADFGAKIAAPFVAPQGRVASGTERFVEAKGAVRQDFDVEDAPPPAPEPTKAEKIAALLGERGLTIADLKEALVN